MFSLSFSFPLKQEISRSLVRTFTNSQEKVELLAGTQGGKAFVFSPHSISSGEEGKLRFLNANKQYQN